MLYTLKNGLRVVVKQIIGVKSLSVAVSVKVGSAQESSRTNGYSHFIEHMHFKGTERLSTYELSRRIEGVGGVLNAFTSKDITCYYTKTASAYKELALDTLSEMLFGTLFDKNEIEKEKLVILEEIKMDADTPDEVCHDEVMKLAFGKHPLSYSVLGKVNNIKKATDESLRAFKCKYYVPKNICIALYGDITDSEGLELAEKYFDRFTCFSSPTKPLVRAELHPQKTVIARNELEQCHVAFATLGGSVDEEIRKSLNVYCNLLGGGVCSRLFQSIREDKGLVYVVYSTYAIFSNNGMLEIYLACNPSNLTAAIAEVDKQLKILKADGITHEEFTHNIEQLKGTLSLSLENTLGSAIADANCVLARGYEYSFDRAINEINAITYDDIMSVLPYYADLDNYVRVIVGKAPQE
ncbi:MAG: pitrilysin family protein [Clostridia bacterium]|nr:pitrilysin family protein [Clostridia bacterium]